MKESGHLTPDKVQTSIEIIERADKASMMMTMLIQELNLNPKECTFDLFLKTFSELMNKKLEAMKVMQEHFVLTSPGKIRKKREKLEAKTISFKANEALDKMQS